MTRRRFTLQVARIKPTDWMELRAVELGYSDNTIETGTWYRWFDLATGAALGNHYRSPTIANRYSHLALRDRAKREVDSREFLASTIRDPYDAPRS